jgi:hypothetical protein
MLNTSKRKSNGRLGQLNKRQRLMRRNLGQWRTPPPTPRGALAATRTLDWTPWNA